MQSPRTVWRNYSRLSRSNRGREPRIRLVMGSVMRKPKDTSLNLSRERRGVDWRKKGVEMIPTMILCGLIFGRWWRVTLVAAALAWPLLLVVTDVAGIDSTLLGAGVLAVVNAGVGVLVHQGVLLAYRRLRRPVSSGVHC